MAYAYDSYYVRFIAAIPFCGYVLLYDKKNVAVTGGIYFALNVFVNIIRIGVQHAYPKEVAIDHIYATFAIGLLIVLIYAITSVAEQFKRDTEGSLKEQHEKQKVMVRDILEVAHEVSEGTQNAMNIVNDLNASTKVVGQTMQDIAGSNQNTAENIQTQTEMSRNIQESIGTTLQYAEFHICMAPEALDIVIKLIKDCKDTYEIIEHKRDTKLIFEDKPFDLNKDVKKGDALVVFGKRKALAVSAQLLNNNIKTSIIYGSLPYSTRKKQFERFLDGETEVIVCTDAIGMGVNLPIKRIVFLETRKYDGVSLRKLNVSEIKQIAGRAGRRGM